MINVVMMVVVVVVVSCLQVEKWLSGVVQVVDAHACVPLGAFLTPTEVRSSTCTTSTKPCSARTTMSARHDTIVLLQNTFCNIDNLVGVM
jgi:hypothetical protein